MRLGICAYNMPARELLELGTHADRLGFDILWLGEHVLMPVAYGTPHPTTGTESKRSHAGPVVAADTALIDPLVELAAIAARTSRIGLGTAMFILPLRHPLLVARAVTSIQEISGNRLWLGVGAGWLEEEFEALGIDFGSRRGRFDEMVKILRLALAGGEFDFKGEHFEIGSIQMACAPVPLPLVYAGNTDRAIRRAVRHGDAWFASGIPSFDEARRLRSHILEISAEERRTTPLRTVFRVDGADPEVIDRYQTEGLDDLVVWADRMWKVGDDPDENLRRLEEFATADRDDGLMSDVAPVRPGEELDWPSLERYLHANLGEAEGPMEVLQFPNGSANLTYLVRFGDHRYVVRRPPFGVLAPGAHDMKREYRALSRLWRSFPPAPRSFLFCDDHTVIGSDFLVSEYRIGEVIWGQIPESMQLHRDVGQRVGLAVGDALADLHLLDPERAGVADLGRPDGFVARQLSGWRKRWELTASDEADAVMTEVAVRLTQATPKPQRASVLHNDYKLDNCQFRPEDPDHVHSIFDWDMATVGDPLVDLGTLLNYWPDPSDEGGDGPIVNDGVDTLGLPTRAELVARYTERTAFDPAPVAWYEAFACWKTAVVLRQLYVRYERGESTDARMAARGPLVLPQARRARAILDANGF